MNRLALALISTLGFAAASSASCQWRYKDRKDPLTDRVERYAYVESLNTHQFRFPYHGGSRARLTMIPTDGPEPDLLFEVTRGQLVCPPSRCVIRLRFDDGDAADYGGVPPADHRANAAFITAELVFMLKVRQAKRLRIAATFYQEGERVFEFRIPDLHWPEPAKQTE